MRGRRSPRRRGGGRRARATRARQVRRRVIRACATRGLRAELRTEGWSAPREGYVTFAAYNVSGRFGRASWRPREDALPARMQNMVAVLTHTDGDNSGACGLQHRSEGSKRAAAGGGVRIVHSDLFAARRVDIAALARDAGIGEFKDIRGGYTGDQIPRLRGDQIYAPSHSHSRGPNLLPVDFSINFQFSRDFPPARQREIKKFNGRQAPPPSGPSVH